MKQMVITKIVMIAILCFLFVIGLGMVSMLISERKYYHDSVMDEIKETYVREQYIITPFLLLQNEQNQQILFADDNDIETSTSVSDSEYHRGIYHAISYHGQMAMVQNFNLKNFDKNQDDINFVQNSPKNTTGLKTNSAKKLSLIIAISDLRGVEPKEVMVGKSSYPVKFVHDGKLPFAYMEADLSDLLNQNLQTLSTDIKISISGMDGIHILPLGENFSASLKSNWNEPKFFGGSLPVQKNLTNQGFTAKWQAGFIAQQNKSMLLGCLKNNENCPNFESQHHNYQVIGTNFVQTNDTYIQTERTVKYALFLVLVSFGTFFLFEMVRGLRIHPVQYGLVASALLVFYVLLLSLAEYVAFALAYLMAASCCVALLGWYTSYVLNTKKRGMLFCAIVATLYGGFYVILSANSFNLLLGSVFCFVLIAVVMYVTRNINWYEIDTKQINEIKQPNQPEQLPINQNPKDEK